MPAPNRANLEKEARANRVASEGLAHQTDREFGRVMFYRAGQAIAAHARAIESLIEMQNNAFALGDCLDLATAHDDGGAQVALDRLLSVLAELGMEVAA